MNITIARIVKTIDVEGKFGPQKRIAFTSNETGEKILSMFSKYELKVGQQLEGDITETEKDGKTYYNFKANFKKAGGMSQEDKDMLQKIYREVYACRQAIVMLNQIFQEKGMLPKSDYPESNGATAFDDPEDAGITEEDLPF